MNLYQYSSVYLQCSNMSEVLGLKIARWAIITLGLRLQQKEFNIYMKKSILLLDLNAPFCIEVLFYHVREIKNIRALTIWFVLCTECSTVAAE